MSTYGTGTYGSGTYGQPFSGTLSPDDINAIAVAVWTYFSRTLTSANCPTVEQIRQEIDANSTKLQEISNKQDDALTRNEFIALS